MFPAHLFPKLAQSGHIVTSTADKSYNCIGFALGDQAKWWWPISGPAESNEPIVFWPAGAHSLEAVEGPLYGIVAAILERPATL